MRSASQIVHAVHGSPAMPDCVEANGRCWLCGGEMMRGMPRSRWAGYDKMPPQSATCPSALMICEGCVFVGSRVSAVLGRDAGTCKVCDGTLRVVRIPAAGKGSRSKKGEECPKCEGTGMQSAGSNFRNLCHLYESGWDGVQAPSYANASKGEKPLIRSFLEREHGGEWFAAIGDTGQRHTLPWAPVNPRGRSGVVIFEDVLLRVPRETVLIGHATDLLTAGATKDEIAAGEYGQNAWRACEESIRAFEREHAIERGSGWFSLALWLAQRDEEAVKLRLAAEKERRENVARNRKGAARRNRQLPRGAEQSVHAEPGTQGSDALDAAGRGARSEPDRRVDDGAVAGIDPPSAAPAVAPQLGLFGDGEARPTRKRKK